MLLSREELDKSAQADPQVAEYYDKNPPGPSTSDPIKMRDGLEEIMAAIISNLGPAPDGTEEFTHDVEMRDGFKSSIKIFKPKSASPGPLIVLCFGGGFIAGSKEQLTETARTLVQLFGATVVNISYRLAPEHKFPIGQLDAWDSMKWIAENAAGPQLNADPAKGFLMGGVSAGGAITASLSRKFQEEKLAHPLTGQWLAVPSLAHAPIVPEKYKERFISHEQNAKAHGLTKEDREMMKNAAQWDLNSELRFAMNSKTPLSGQPRSYFQVDGLDPLRDDGLIYEEMLKEAGAPTKIDFYPGCPHAHWYMMRGYEVGDRARIDTMAGFAWLLEKDLSRAEIAKALDISL